MCRRRCLPGLQRIVGETEASAYKLVDGQRVPAEEVLVRIARSYIYVNGDQPDARPCSAGPPPVRDATRNASSLVSCLQREHGPGAAVTYEVWAVRGPRQVLVDTHIVMSEVVATPEVAR